jgi:hypothetical protein
MGRRSHNVAFHPVDEAVAVATRARRRGLIVGEVRVNE